MIAGQALAQRTFNAEPTTHRSPITFAADRTPTDTLIPSGFLGGPLTFYTVGSSLDSGFVFGSNVYGDLQKAQYFNVSGSVNVEEIVALVALKAGAGNIGFNVLAADGNGVDADQVEITTAPGTVLGGLTVALADVDTANANFFALPAVVPVTGSFYLSMDFSALSGTNAVIALFSSTANVAGIDPNGSWEQWGNDSWVAMSAAWNGNQFDAALFAIIDDGSTNVGSIDRVNGLQMTLLGGNPATSNVQVMYDLEHAAKARLVVMDMKGARVVDTDLGRTMSGEHRMDLDVANWANGTYMVTIFADGLPMTKKLVVQH